MSSQYTDLHEAARLVYERCEKLSSLRDDVVDARYSADFAMFNCRDQQEHLRKTQRQLIDRISAFVRNLDLDHGSAHLKELEEIRTLDRQQEEHYEYSVESIKKFQAEEAGLLRVESKTKRRERRLRKACKKAVETIEPILTPGTEETGTTTGDSDSVHPRAEASIQSTDTMHPKLREYHQALSRRKMLLEQLEIAKSEYESQLVSRGFLEDKGEFPSDLDIELEAQLHAEVVEDVALCDRSFETIQVLRQECFALSLSFNDIMAEDSAKGQMSAELQSGIGTPCLSSPALSGIKSIDNHLPRLDSVQTIAPSTMYTATTGPLITEFPSRKKSRREQEDKAEAVKQWIEVTPDPALNSDIEQLAPQLPADSELMDLRSALSLPVRASCADQDEHFEQHHE